MSYRGNCPQCGAPIQFRFAQSVQTVCTYCNSVLVRHDVNLDKVGEQAELPRHSSPIQIGTEGKYRDKFFQVVGRIAYEYELGGWNEWHILFADGRSAWIADAQADYAVSLLAPGDYALPARENLTRGLKFRFGKIAFEVTSITKARYLGVEGELPFEYWDKEWVLFADLRSTNRNFATIDYSEEKPLLFVGEAVDFEELNLKNLREFEGW